MAVAITGSPRNSDRSEKILLLVMMVLVRSPLQLFFPSTKFQSKGFHVQATSGCARIVYIPIQRRRSDLPVYPLIVAQFRPFLGCLIQECQIQRLLVFQHSHQLAFEMSLERFLLAVLVCRICQGPFMRYAQ